MRKKIIILFLISLTFVSCNDDGLHIFSNGETVTQQRELYDYVNTIDLYNNVDVVLIQSDEPHIELTSGENIIDKITTEIIDSTLIIRNENTFNWARDYDYPITMKVYYNRLKTINYRSVGDLTCTDSICGDTTYSETGEPRTEFFLNQYEGSGDIDLILKCKILHVQYQYGTSIIKLSGSVGLNYTFQNSFGSIHAENLYTNMTFLTTNSTNNNYVWFRASLSATINSIGNVYFRGYAPNAYRHGDGEGQLIKIVQ